MLNLNSESQALLFNVTDRIEKQFCLCRLTESTDSKAYKKACEILNEKPNKRTPALRKNSHQVRAFLEYMENPTGLMTPDEIYRNQTQLYYELQKQYKAQPANHQLALAMDKVANTQLKAYTAVLAAKFDRMTTGELDEYIRDSRK